MSDPISPNPWDLAAGNRWTIQSEDHRIANDRGNETVVDANGTVIAYVAGDMENGNGALLAAAPALRDALIATLEWEAKTRNRLGLPQIDAPAWVESARAALKQAGAL